MKRILYFPLFLFLASCATQPKPMISGKEISKAQWETKAVVRDLKANKSHSLSIDVLADYPQNFRMEVSALMGVQVASLVLSDQNIKYVLYHQKRAYEGKATEASFLPLMNVPLHPVNFMNVALDKPMQGSGWSCARGADKMVSECQQEARGIKVQWSDRTVEGQKKVLITGPTFEMRWLFKPPQTDVQFKEQTFRLEAPAEFKSIQLK
ncbi:MAG: hypothetical protein EOP06_16865 [Proteobacteria bacterium]|nr:MAG: hypothetical protein EOP06_16865 [Pseudomonadota bacterium]